MRRFIEGIQTMQTHRAALVACAAAVVLALGGCKRTAADTAPAVTPSGETPAPTNRIDINASVRQNLGITFAQVETRDVARTLRVPGRFELLPTARREYRVSMPGTVELLVEQYQSVEIGTPLFKLDSPRWRELQGQLTEATANVALAEAEFASIAPFMAAHENHHREIQNAVALWTERVAVLERLQSAGGARGEDVAQAKASLATVRSDLAETFEKEAELTARGVEATTHRETARARLTLLMQSAASLSGRTPAELVTIADGTPLWQTLGTIEVRALSRGVIDELPAPSGSFVDQNAMVMATVQPEEVRFRANAMQSDLGRLSNGLSASVVAPQGGSLANADAVAGTLTLAPTAQAERRTIEIIMTPTAGVPVAAWARAGVAGFVEVVMAGAGRAELAIPLSCVARDGTKSIIFRRDPKDPNMAIRMEADLGIDDGRWVVVQSGVAEGNEIVLDGVYQLMVATSGSITKGGHFHPDGTFHEGDE